MSQSAQIDWGSVAQWAGAVCTFLAVLTALFKEEFLRWSRRPVLNVKISLAPPDCQITKLTLTYPPLTGGPEGFIITPPSVTSDCYYLRLLVENIGKTTAERVQVFAAKLLKKQVDSTFRKVDGFLPMNLKWAHSHEIYADVIHPEMCKHCDLGHILDPASRRDFPDEEDPSKVHTDKTILSLDLEVQANTMGHLILPGVYKLVLKVAGANCTPLTKVLEITITGEWFTEEQRMFSDGLGVRVLE